MLQISSLRVKNNNFATEQDVIFVLKTRAKLPVSVLGVSNCFEEIFCKLQHQIVLG